MGCIDWGEVFDEGATAKQYSPVRHCFASFGSGKVEGGG